MEQLLIKRLHSYIIQNNPDLLLSLEGESRISHYLQEKVASLNPLIERLVDEERAPYFIEEECMDILTRDLRPSKFHFLSDIMARAFPNIYFQFHEAGVLTYELSNIIALTIDLFEEHGFTEDMENDPGFEQVIIWSMAAYLDDVNPRL